MKTTENNKDSFKEFRSILFVAFDVFKEDIVKQIEIIGEKEEIMVSLIRLPSEFLCKKEIIYNNSATPSISEEAIKPYYIIVFRMAEIRGVKQPSIKLDYGGYYETEEAALKDFEQVKEEIKKDMQR